jgi:hypothetical protein
MQNKRIMFVIIVSASAVCLDMIVHDGDQKRSKHMV